MPESFVNIYLKITLGDGREAYSPLDSILIGVVGMPSELWVTGEPTPFLMVFGGGIVIVDPNEVLLNVGIVFSAAFSAVSGDTSVMSLVVSILKTG